MIAVLGYGDDVLNRLIGALCAELAELEDMTTTSYRRL
jgi:hypothetical protein